MQMPSQPASAKRLVEIGREAALFVLLQPIGIVETRADLADGVADRLLIGCERKVHGASIPSRAPGAGLVTPSRTSAAISAAEIASLAQNFRAMLIEARRQPGRLG